MAEGMRNVIAGRKRDGEGEEGTDGEKDYVANCTRALSGCT